MNWRKTAVMVSGSVFLCLSQGHAAETPVGLEAGGFFAWASLHNSLGLDVRDLSGHPVSVQAVLKDIKTARVHEVENASAVSFLPRARVLLAFLEVAGLERSGWRPPRLRLPELQFLALPPPSKAFRELPLHGVGLLPAVCCLLALIAFLPGFRSFLQLRTIALRC